MRIADAFTGELEIEAATTRRVLERVPGDRLSWRPHPKSSSLGELSLHVATLPREFIGFIQTDRLDFNAVDTRQPMPESKDSLLTAFEDSLQAARAYFAALDDAGAMSMWTLAAADRDLFSAPRAGVIRSFLFNHLYHHRGQLLVYLRLLDVPLPSVYGPSADENPFAGAVS
jgi:uncharacterized damage-inducible protein DinB